MGRQTGAQLADAGAPATRGVRTGRTLGGRENFEFDHCIAYARWYDNSLSNPSPSTSRANQSKSDRLPEPDLLGGARERVADRSENTYVGSERYGRFVFEADVKSPGTDFDLDTDGRGAILEAVD